MISFAPTERMILVQIDHCYQRFAPMEQFDGMKNDLFLSPVGGKAMPMADDMSLEMHCTCTMSAVGAACEK